MNANEEYVCRAIQAGAAGYLLKDADPGELEKALRTVASGETYLTPAISKHVISYYLRRVGGEKTIAEPLTPRQREILKLIAQGKSTKEIAGLLKISSKTVETHRAQLMDRLEIHDIAGLVRYAIRSGLVELES
jgi:DNA-binding NarL/FixJ family response regulator